MATVATDTASAGEPTVLQEKSSGPLQTPITAPTTTSKPVQKPELTSEQQKKFDWLLERVKAWTEVPSTKGKAGPLTDDENFWLTKECLFRYLRATKWHEKDSEKRILDTLTWRREYGVAELTPDYISPEQETGKQLVMGFDKQARPCQYLNPGRQNTDLSPRQNQHLVFMLERVIDLMPAGQETICLLINFKTSKTRSNTAPGISQGREVLHILQTHYPERLGRALIINVPWVVSGFFKLITPFIDPMTREKLKFNDDMTQYVPKEQLWTEFPGGEQEFDYDHSVYWPAFIKMAQEKRAARKQKWQQGGKQIGESELYLAGALERGVAGPVQAVEPTKTEQPSAAPTPAVVSPSTAAAAETEPAATHEK